MKRQSLEADRRPTAVEQEVSKIQFEFTEPHPFLRHGSASFANSWVDALQVSSVPITSVSSDQFRSIHFASMDLMCVPGEDRFTLEVIYEIHEMDFRSGAAYSSGARSRTDEANRPDCGPSTFQLRSWRLHPSQWTNYPATCRSVGTHLGGPQRRCQAERL